MSRANIHSLAWVDCEHPGCQAGITIDIRHLKNFTGRDWLCRDHEGGTPDAA